jgi:hypothetical protein
VSVGAVRHIGVIHHFMMLNALRPTRAADAAIRATSGFLRRTLDH